MDIEKEDLETIRNWTEVKCDFSLLYKMTRDGCNAWTFHTKCDNQGPTVTFFKNNFGTIYGGYTSQSWNSPRNAFHSYDDKAFLFQVRNKGDKVNKMYPIKPEKSCYAIMNAHDHGPMFGDKELPYFVNCVKPKDGSYAFKDDTVMNYYDMKGDNYENFINSSSEITETEVYKVHEHPMFDTIEKPWRNIMENSWKHESFLDMKKNATSYRPPDNVDFTCVNILLIGEVGAGKSSFINTVDAVFKGSLSAMANMGSAPNSLTKRFRMYGFKDDENKRILNFRICDTRGIAKGDGFKIDPVDFCHMLDGHMSDGYVFNPEVQLDENTPGFITDAHENDRIDIVAIVIDASSVNVFQQDILREIKILQSKATQRELTQVVLLTKTDKLYHHLRDDASKTFYLPIVEQTVDKAAEMFGLPPQLVFPVINYNKEAVPNENIDTLTLLALNQMLNFINDRFKVLGLRPGDQLCDELEESAEEDPF